MGLVWVQEGGACARAPRLRSWVAAAAVVAGGGSASAAAKPGVIMTWGRDADGQLGNGTASGRLAAAAVPGMTGIIDMSGGREHVVALKQDGTVWAWGHNNDAQIGTRSARSATAPGPAGSCR